jgi:hypothetical protein
VSFYQALQVAILSGMLFGAFLYFMLRTLGFPDGFLLWLSSALVGVLFGASQVYVYRQLLQ